MTTQGRWPANVVHDGSPQVLACFPQEPVAGSQRNGGIRTAPVMASMARFFYSGKADKRDKAGSDHPTVKPQALMRWLVAMTTPRNGRVLDMFAGSGSTGWAAATEGRQCDLVERDPGYAAHIRCRMADFDPDAAAYNAAPASEDTQTDLFGGL